MSFLKRFKLVGTTSETSTTKPSTSKKCQEVNEKSSNKQRAPTAISSASDGELSLFSGMTFSSTASGSESPSGECISSESPSGECVSSESPSGECILDKSKEDEHHVNTSHGLQELEELKEVFEHVDFQVTKGGEEIKESPDCSLENEKECTAIEREFQQETQSTVISSSVQQGKKKKRTQAKRPGYARDNKNVSHLKPKATGGGDVTLDDTPTIQKKEEVAVDLGHPSITDEVQLDFQSRDEPEYDTSEKQTDTGEETFSKQGTKHLYSIDTPSPSSSEENLVPAGKEQQQQDSIEKFSEDVQEEEEVKEILDFVSIKTETIHDQKTLDKDFGSTPKLEENIVKENSDREEAIFSKEDIHVTVVEPKSKERDQASSVNKDGNLKEERLIERDRTYNLQLDAEDKTSLVEQDMQFRISGLRDEEKILQELESELIQNYSNTNSAYIEKQRDLENLAQEETNALANDNYDLAEELSLKIEELKESLEKAKYKIPAVDSKVQKALQLRSELSLKRLSILRDAQASLEELREEQAASLDAFNDENNAIISQEKQSLNAERQRLDRAHAHLQLDTEHLEKEETMLEDEIQQRTEEYVKRKEILKEEREKIRDEMAELERRLEQLRINETDCTKNIEAEDFKIKEIKEEFLPQREPLNKQRQELEDLRNLLKSDQESLKAAQKRYDELVESWTNKKKRFTELLNSLQENISRNGSAIDVLEKQRGEIEEFLCLKHLSLNKDKTLDKLRSSVKQTSQQIKSLSSKTSLSERNLASLRKRVTEIEDQISDRNEAKDIAKKERNFKEAKRLKEEIEALKTEGIESQGKLECCLKELDQDTVLLQTKEKEFEKEKEELDKKEHESDLKLVNSATKVVRGLQEQVTRYVNNEFLHTLLTTEVSTCQNLINQLCSKHGISVPTIEKLMPQDGTLQGDELECVNEEVDEKLSSDRDTNEEREEALDEGSKEELLNQLDKLEGKLEAVVDMEDFDEADRIQEEIIKLKTKLEQNS